MELTDEKWAKHLIAASGYLELGMVEDAAAEIEEIAPEDKMRQEVVMLRVEIYRSAKKWDAMAALANYLVEKFPDEPGGWLDWAWAVRREKSVEDALPIMRQAAAKFDTMPLVHYNLACYECLMGDMQVATKHLKHAFALDKKFKLIALDDPDLEALWEFSEKPE
jgi:tetratricopeptide (TPR) repeat protein